MHITKKRIEEDPYEAWLARRPNLTDSEISAMWEETANRVAERTTIISDALLLSGKRQEIYELLCNGEIPTAHDLVSAKENILDAEDEKKKEYNEAISVFDLLYDAADANVKIEYRQLLSDYGICP